MDGADDLIEVPVKQPFQWRHEQMERVSGLMSVGSQPKVGEPVIAVDPEGDRRKGVVESLTRRGNSKVRVIVTRLRPI